MILLLPGVLSVNLDVEKSSSDEIMILDIESPATFNLEVTNNGVSDSFTFYTFFGLLESPKEAIKINSGETKNIELKILPTYNLQPGFSNFEVFIRGTDNSETSKELLVKIANLGDIFEIGSKEIDSESSTMQIYIKNKENYNFENLDVKFSSVFFDFEESFSLNPNEEKSFEVKLDKEDFKKVLAGFYTLTATINTNEAETKVEGVIKFAEKNILEETSKDSGFIVSTTKIEKTNEGNTIQSSETTIKKNIISRLFTSFSPEADLVERDGAKIYYTWIKDIKPGETLTIKARTNWMFPFIVIFLIVSIVTLVKKFSKRDLSLRKKVSFVNAKGGEFALKVSIVVHAKKYVEKVDIIERLPALVKVYERFGREEPTKVDEAKKRIEWHFEKLEAGEVRVLTYVIYSKVGVVGKFALPSTAAIYEKDGEIKDTSSNLAFFVAEQRRKDSE